MSKAKSKSNPNSKGKIQINTHTRRHSKVQSKSHTQTQDDRGCARNLLSKRVTVRRSVAHDHTHTYMHYTDPPEATLSISAPTVSFSEYP